MEIGLIFPNKDRRYKTIHLGLAYISAYARSQHNDLNFSILDTRTAGKKETKAFFNKNFDLIGMTVFSPVYFEVIELFQKIKTKMPGTPIVLGGPYVTTIKDEIFNETPADYAVVGEGEITFSELISHLRGQLSIESINGLMYMDRDGKVFINKDREKLKDLDVLPMPAYDLFPMKRYPLHRMVTSRGCPYACVWCNSSSVWNHTYRRRNAELVVNEIEFLVNTYGKKIFVFGDNSLNISLDWVREFCDLLIARNLNILWSASVRADIMTEEIACKMKQAGCYNVAIGIESANNEILKHIRKNTEIEKIKEGIAMLKKAGIEVLSQYVIGNPHETLETIKESINFAKTSGCDYSNFYTVIPFKGTAQWDYVAEHGTFLGKHTHDFHSVKPKIVFVTPEFGYKDRLEAIRLVKKEGFYSNKDKKSLLFDIAKEVARLLQETLSGPTGERIYLMLKSIYKLKMVKKNNI